MKQINADQLAELLPWPELVARMKFMFDSTTTVPERLHYSVGNANMRETPTLLLMPAWNDEFLGVKIVNVFPDNAQNKIAALNSTYLLYSNRTGQTLASIDGNQLTAMRTAATSAAAADFLARKDAQHLLLVGAGRVASLLPAAYSAVRKLQTVKVWNRHSEAAEKLVAQLRAQGFKASVANDLKTTVETSDIISAATLSTQPLILGAWVQPGTHVDLIGGFRENMREADDALVANATLFADTKMAWIEAGDFIHPLKWGLIEANAITTLDKLCSGQHPGRNNDKQITLFKSVGSALADIAAASLAYSRLG
jgi:ornithine cyclodeaminase/alanine dehydrogenase-like protein (mu-crystallin family)